MMDEIREDKNLIKVFDEKLAVKLINGGFSYMKENINGDMDVLVFENNTEIQEFLDALSANECSRFGDDEVLKISFGNTLMF